MGYESRSLELGMTDGDGDWTRYVVGKLAADTLWGVLDQYLVESRGLACVLLGTGELV